MARFWVTTIGSLVALIWACSGLLAADAVTLRFLTDGSDQYLQSTRTFFKAFEQQNPDIKIDLEIGDYDKFLTEVAAGTPPDLVRLLGSNTTVTAAQGLLTDLDPYLQASHVLKADDLIPVIRDQGLSYGGKLYAIPFGVSVITLFYNRDHFAEAGLSDPDASWSWQAEGIAAGKKLVKAGADGKITRFFLPATSGSSAYPFVFSAGGRLFSDDGHKALFASPQAVEGLQLMHDLAWGYHVMARPGESADFAAGTASAYYEGSWYVTELQNAHVPFAWNVALLPSFDGRRGTRIWPETPIGIPTGSPHPQAAWRVLEWVGGPDGQRLLTKLGLAMPPISLSAGRTAFTEEHPDLATDALIQLATLPDTHVLPPTPGEAVTPLSSAISKILSNSGAVGAVLDASAQQANAALAAFWAKIGK